ncbi:hypothetical protein NHP200010_07710 [Helicobacter bizzozeronii]|uniref:tetratricopeptide repeat protein n=1 Tax=Helicobacter bizzozeronii TaxID=56877 RepID=UPI00244D9727|nr:tetratricopeptide repeat protein [Helicobacter bizzozeronii]GMB93059.1 hypothetical protein NHP200010_07710 [Helicobacter bizzozeronii]
MVFNDRVIKVVGALVLSVALCGAQSHRGKKFLEKTHEYYQQKNYDKVFVYSTKAANTGEARGYVFLGDLYLKGQGVRQDYKKAVAYFQKAADMGDAGGHYYLGHMYFSGQGVSKDYFKALEHFQRAADMGDGRAYLSLGIMYLNGQGGGQG